jgi:hypothetical protein
MRALIIAAMLLVPAQTHALEIGARLPTRYGEVIVVKNDGGVKNWTTYFPYGSICHTDLNLKTWLIVKRIVGEQTLLVVDFGVESIRLSCPHGTETNTPYAQARKRYEDYVRALDDKFFSISTEGIDVGERPQRQHAPRDARLRGDPRGCDGGVREELAARVKPGTGRLFLDATGAIRSDCL